MTKPTPITIYRTSPELEKNGIWLDFGNGLRIKIRRAGGRNLFFEQVLQAKMKPYRFQIEHGRLDPETDQKLLREAYAEAVIIDWQWMDQDGNPLPFTTENVLALLEADPDLFGEIRQQAQKLANFAAEQLEQDAKNLPTGSAGNESGAMSSSSLKSAKQKG